MAGGGGAELELQQFYTKEKRKMRLEGITLEDLDLPTVTGIFG